VETDLTGSSSYRPYYEIKRDSMKKPPFLEYFVEEHAMSYQLHHSSLLGDFLSPNTA
jgi:hypothetical protein